MKRDVEYRKRRMIVEKRYTHLKTLKLRPLPHSPLGRLFGMPYKIWKEPLNMKRDV